MNKTTRLIRMALALLTAGLLAGCSAIVIPPVYSGPPTSASVTDETIISHGPMVKKYNDAAELAADSSLLVLGKVVESEQVTIIDLLFTRYTIAVESRFAGETDREIAVYLLGERGWQVHLDVPAYFNEGQRYILFLRATGLEPGTQGADGYYVVGPGVWGETSDSGFTIWVDPAADVDIARIPSSFELGEAAELLSADHVETAS